jgi:hypothetical protein
LCREVQGYPKLPYAHALGELTENPTSAYTPSPDLGIHDPGLPSWVQELIDRKARKKATREALQEARNYGLIKRHQQKINHKENQS